MMGIEILEHTERQLTDEEARQLYASMADQVLYTIYTLCLKKKRTATINMT